jgi:hypothetical protein
MAISAGETVSRLAMLLVLMFVLAGCGDVTGPCSDADPVGICASSHSQTYEGH